MNTIRHLLCAFRGHAWRALTTREHMVYTVAFETAEFYGWPPLAIPRAICSKCGLVTKRTVNLSTTIAQESRAGIGPTHEPSAQSTRHRGV